MSQNGIVHVFKPNATNPAIQVPLRQAGDRCRGFGATSDIALGFTLRLLKLPHNELLTETHNKNATRSILVESYHITPSGKLVDS
jgi:hypothetical protein